MNIEYLKYFSELAKIQHYGKAAKALNISQPGLSHAIKSLEEEYGVPLFQKEGRNVSLSHYGKELMKDVDEILGAYLRLEERAGRTSDGRENGADRQCVSSGTGDDSTYAERVWGDISIYHLQSDDTGDCRRTFGWKI